MEPADVSATQAAYDAAAAAYVDAVGTELTAATEGPLDRALLAAFVEYVHDSSTKLVADVGCGPGRVAAVLAGHGLEAIGIDISSEMLVVARAAHPSITFQEGELTGLPVDDGTLGGVVCWYSIIHTPPADLEDVCTEFLRVLTPDGYVLLAFQAGNGERVDRSGVYGTSHSLTNFRHSPDQVASCLIAAGLQVHARLVREPQFAHERGPQAFILGRAPA